jgi:hypothetical protein
MTRIERRERNSDPLSVSLEMALSPCPPKKIKLERYPDPSERGNNSWIQNKTNYFVHKIAVLLYAKQENEEVFHPLHLVPPTLVGLALAVSLIQSIHLLYIHFIHISLIQIENKYKLEAKNIRNIYKRCKKG